MNAGCVSAARRKTTKYDVVEARRVDHSSIRQRQLHPANIRAYACDETTKISDQARTESFQNNNSSGKN